MNTYSNHTTYGPWPESPDADYFLADLIEALALEKALEKTPVQRTSLVPALIPERSQAQSTTVFRGRGIPGGAAHSPKTRGASSRRG